MKYQPRMAAIATKICYRKTICLYVFDVKIQTAICLTSLSMGGSPPASTSNTFQSLFSVKRFAKTLPAEKRKIIIKNKF